MTKNQILSFLVPMSLTSCVGSTEDGAEERLQGMLAEDPEARRVWRTVMSEEHNQFAGSSGAAVGGGVYAIGDLDVDFYVAALGHDQAAHGVFRHKTAYDGLTADFAGRVTCLAVDDENGRAWIGGVVTRNRSTDPDYAEAIFQPGRDIWFRAVDYGPGSYELVDRTTFVGFEGGGGIVTSQEYCDARIWPDEDARTWPVTAGSITVFP